MVSRWDLRESSDLQLFVADTLADEMIWCIPLFGDLAEFRGAETVCSIRTSLPTRVLLGLASSDGDPLHILRMVFTGSDQREPSGDRMTVCTQDRRRLTPNAADLS